MAIEPDARAVVQPSVESGEEPYREAYFAGSTAELAMTRAIEFVRENLDALPDPFELRWLDADELADRLDDGTFDASVEAVAVVKVPRDEEDA